MSATHTNRGDISLPTDVSKEIIQKTQEASAVMRLAEYEDLPGRGLTIPMITSDPDPEWVGETENKPVSNPGLGTKVMQGYTLSVIVPFSNQFKRDMPRLYDALVARLPKVLGKKFDNTVFGGTQAPGDKFDTFANVTAHSISSNAYDALVDLDTQVSMEGGINSGFVLSPQAKGLLLKAKDEEGRPLFINSVSENAIPYILSTPTLISKGAYIAGSPNVVGFGGDWSQAKYGIVEDVSIDISKEASLTLEDGSVINLFQKNMFAVRAEIECGFIADTSVFGKLTASTVPSF